MLKYNFSDGNGIKHMIGYRKLNQVSVEKMKLDEVGVGKRGNEHITHDNNTYPLPPHKTKKPISKFAQKNKKDIFLIPTEGGIRELNFLTEI